MATQHTIKTRIQLKNDTEANWNKARNFIPLKGELIIYSADESHPFSRLKVGDGITTVVALPFVSTGSIDEHAIAVDITTNWLSNTSYIPNRGDIVIWLDKTISDSLHIPGIKIGDGLSYNVDLPFVGDDIAIMLQGHINDEVCHISQEEREKWNNKTFSHKLTFGAGGAYVFDGSEDVTVPVYMGTTI